MAAAQPGQAPHEVWKFAWPAALVALAGFVVAFQFVDPAPPERFTIAAGERDGAYYRFAERYRETLARHGIELDVLETAGSVENLERLRAGTGDVSVAFVQGGTGEGGGDLVSLASLYYEPLWVFARASVPVETLGDLAGRRIAIGVPGSGTRALALDLLGANGVEARRAQFLDLAGQAAVDALARADVDAVFVVAAATSQTVAALAALPESRLVSFRRAGAYVRRYRHLTSVTVPEGVLDLAKDIPPRDAVLVAATANLVARPDFHPALIDLMLEAASEVHRTGGLFESFDQFPSPRYVEFPLSEEARRYLERGPSFLRRVLPFWAATLVERMVVLLLPLVALLIPLIRIMPPVYRWRIRYRIYRWYGELLAVDPLVHGIGDDERRRTDLAELDRIEEEVAKVNVPLSYADELYALRMHLDRVRRKLEAAVAPGADST